MREFETILECHKAGREFALVTVISDQDSTPRSRGARMLVFPGGEIEFTVGGGELEALAIKEALKALEEGVSRKITVSLNPQKSNALCGGEMELSIGVGKPRQKLLILGGGHVGKKIAELCEVIGLPYEIADDRGEFANRERFPLARQILAAPYPELFKKARIDENTFLVIVTRGHEHDEACLREALTTNAAYIGMIGSKHKVKALFAKLKQDGLDPEADPRVYSPIGLKLGDKTPGEIAVSVMAEILLIKSQGQLAHWRDI